MESISVLSILRNNVGKDLSTIAMPIALNEPLNLLQKLAEELEYCDLLDAAADAENVVDRMVLVSAFAVSGYASTVNRAGRKPFNPLLGETFECIRPDKGFRFVSEKVSHHPPVMACHAESPKYTFYQDNLVKSKFWGKSMELVPSGTVNVTLPSKKDHLQWTKVTTCMRNVFAGTRYLEHYGTMKITSLSTGYTSVLTFKEAGYFSSAKNEVVGTVFDCEGGEVAWICGKWDDALYRFEKSSPNNLQVIWRATPCPAHHAQMYGFTQLAVELNELTPDIEHLLPITDTRFRTDQRLYEDGKIDEAEREKLRLEQKQRETRKRMEMEGVKWEPKWFVARGGEGEGSEWRYKGGYFESRGGFPPMESIF
ncbi:Oxysterol-binding protein [Obelidium mucronatum]|nr:Oxysterol-binding protein [Obelidium mucronatum]